MPSKLDPDEYLPRLYGSTVDAIVPAEYRPNATKYTSHYKRLVMKLVISYKSVEHTTAAIRRACVERLQHSPSTSRKATIADLRKVQQNPGHFTARDANPASARPARRAVSPVPDLPTPTITAAAAVPTSPVATELEGGETSSPAANIGRKRSPEQPKEDPSSREHSTILERSLATLLATTAPLRAATIAAFVVECVRVAELSPEAEKALVSALDDFMD